MKRFVLIMIALAKTLATLALQYSDVNQIVGSRFSFAPDHTSGRNSSI